MAVLLQLRFQHVQARHQIDDERVFLGFGQFAELGIAVISSLCNGSTQFTTAEQLRDGKESDCRPAQGSIKIKNITKACAAITRPCMETKAPRTNANAKQIEHKRRTGNRSHRGAGVEADAGVVDLGKGAKPFLAPARTRQWARDPKVRMLA